MTAGRKAGLLVGLVILTSMACGCAPEVSQGPAGSAGTSSTGSGGADAGGADAGAADAAAEWTHDPGETYSSIMCKDDGMQLFVELWPPSAQSACVPDPAVSDVLVLGIEGWDGEPGTFVLGEETEHGTAQAGYSLSLDPLEGTLTVEPFAETPQWISWELSVDSGRTDLGLCGKFSKFPCATP